MEIVKITDDLVISDFFILVTYTTDFGCIPDTTKKFLENNHRYMIGVAGSGNRNWGDVFAKSADKISIMYKVPIVHKFELAGLNKDVEIFKETTRRLFTKENEDETY